jgi:hypothetical protein
MSLRVIRRVFRAHPPSAYMPVDLAGYRSLLRSRQQLCALLCGQNPASLHGDTNPAGSKAYCQGTVDTQQP